MGNILKSHWSLPFLFLSFFVLALMSCGVIAPLFAAPTATLPAKVDSPLQSKLIGQWKLSGSVPWNEATVTFHDDGSFSMVDSAQAIEVEGTYFFTSENAIAYILPTEQGSMTLEFLDDDNINFVVTKSTDVFGVIVTAERVK